MLFLAVKVVLGFGLGMAMQYYYMPSTSTSPLQGLLPITAVFLGSTTAYYLLWR